MKRAELVGSGYSLWLLPKPGTEAHHELNKLIPEVAQKYDTPSFAAHATLVGSVQGAEEEVRRQTRETALQLRPYELVGKGELDSIDGVLHRTLFTRVARTSDVLRAHEMAQGIFGTKGEYDPHVSFAYGGLSPAEVDDLKMFITGRNRLIASVRFEVDAIGLWRTEGTVPDWHEVATFPFGKR